MWMMIAGSASLRDLHERARLWLVIHEHEAEANMVLRKGGQAGQSSRGSKKQVQVKRPGPVAGLVPPKGRNQEVE